MYSIYLLKIWEALYSSTQMTIFNTNKSVLWVYSRNHDVRATWSKYEHPILVLKSKNAEVCYFNGSKYVRSIQDYCITLTTQNSTQIKTSRQCMLNQYTSPQTDTFHIVSWYIQKVLLLCQMLSHFVSIDSYQHRRSSHFVFDFPKLNLCQHVFTLNFFICTCDCYLCNDLQRHCPSCYLK